MNEGFDDGFCHLPAVLPLLSLSLCSFICEAGTATDQFIARMKCMFAKDLAQNLTSFRLGL